MNLAQNGLLVKKYKVKILSVITFAVPATPYIYDKTLPAYFQP
jgi:hypothetical protein